MASSKNIRNFSIVAHIDHGKSTLADRLLELTGTVHKRKMREQILDGMELERERGITIKAKAVRMSWKKDDQEYVLNLVDTPGHVDFTYEVSRALAACEGAILVIDASQGVEAQTLANATLAREAGLVLVPVINKIDLPQIDLEAVKSQIKEILDINTPPLMVSAKEGKGIEEVLSAIIDEIPPPTGDSASTLSALVFDSLFDTYRGVIIYLRIINGVIRSGMKVTLVAAGINYTVEEVGYLQMENVKTDFLDAGGVGYAICGIKDIHQVRIGDTLTETNNPSSFVHPGYKELKPFVFAGLYPIATVEYENLKNALGKLHLSDSSFYYQADNSNALGFGFRCGFLGLLHLDIIKERIEREFNINMLVTAPNVIYRVRTVKGDEFEVTNPAKFPSYGDIQTVKEPYVLATLILPSEFVGPVMQLCQDRRGKFIDMRYMTTTRVILKYRIPLSEIVIDFYDNLKSVSKGYASFDYDHAGFKPGKLLKLEILINNDPIDAFSFIVPAESAYLRGRAVVENLKKMIPRQFFEVPIQAKIRGRIIVRDTIRSIRKDVLAKCYGGDITRKRKLLEKQKEGKKRMKQFGKVEIPQEAFLSVLKMGK